MEGSRHEKAALVSIAYGIGMLTAFIWFGQNPVSVGVPIFTYTNQAASVIESVVPEEEELASTLESQVETLVAYENGVLSVNNLGDEVILSFNPDVTGYEADSEFMKQGAHYGKLVYLVSPSQEYVFFCEQKAVDAAVCSPFVYDVLGDTIHTVKQNNQLVELLISAADLVSWSDTGLTIGESVSSSASTPWLLKS